MLQQKELTLNFCYWRTQMLKLLRKKGVSKKLIWVVAIIIIISFGFLGTAYLISGNFSNKYAGKMFGKKISLEDFSEAFQMVKIQSIMRYGDKFQEMQQYLDLESETWDRLLLMHETKKRRIQIKDDDVVKTIEEYGFFQRDGQFDTLIYNDVLRYVFKVKPRDFEENVRENLKFQKLFAEETESITISEDVIFNTYKEQNEKVQISYALISPQDFKDQVYLQDSDRQSYYDQNKLAFLVPPSINVQYISLDFPPLTDEISDEKKDALKEEIQNEADDIYQEILVQSDLRASAQKHQLVVQESGFFSQEEPLPSLGWSYDFLNTLFTLKEGDISDIYESEKGIIIAKIGEKRDSFIPSLEDLSDKLDDAAKLEKSKSLAKKNALEYLTKLKDIQSKTEFFEFSKSAKELNLNINQTPTFKRGQYLPKIGISNTFQEAAFALSKKQTLSSVVETTVGFCILYLDDYFEADKEQYEKEKSEFSQKLLDLRKGESFTDFVTQIRAQAKIEDNLANLRQ